MARNRAERRQNTDKKYTNRLEKELAINKFILDNKGKKIDKPTIKDLKQIKSLKGKKNHAVDCSCSMCSNDKFKRAPQTNAKKKVIKDGEDDFDFETKFDEDDFPIRNIDDDEDDDDLFIPREDLFF